MKWRDMSFVKQWLIIFCRRAYPGRYVPEVQAFLEAHGPEYREARAWKAREAETKVTDGR